jgi:ClpP class serine protease
MHAQIFHELPRITAALLTEPWMIVPSHHRALLEQCESFLQRSAADVSLLMARVADNVQPPGAVNRVATFDKVSGLAVVNVRGVLGKGIPAWMTDFGFVSLDEIEGALDLLRALPVNSVALHVSSPGGTVNGVEEAAAAIRAFSDEVAPVFAYTDTMACSAAYWLAASANTFHAAPSAYVGSIGVYSYLIDSSAAWARNGLKMVLASSGPQKAAGFPGVEVTEEQIAALRTGVARMADRFFGYVRSRRAGIGDDALDGDFWPAQDAPAALHDGLMRSRADHLGYAWAHRRPSPD